MQALLTYSFVGYHTSGRITVVRGVFADDAEQREEGCS
jgi:hypothetical protein